MMMKRFCLLIRKLSPSYQWVSFYIGGSALHQIDVVSFEECLVDKPERIDPQHLPLGLI